LGVGALTCKLAVPVELAKCESPEYAAVIVSFPTGAVAARHDPDPLTKAPVVHNVVEPVVNDTVPVGVPLAEATVAEKVTELPKEVEVGLTETAVVVGAGENVCASSVIVNEPLLIAPGEARIFPLPSTMSTGFRRPALRFVPLTPRLVN
jgi:hypothetical protein